MPNTITGAVAKKVAEDPQSKVLVASNGVPFVARIVFPVDGYGIFRDGKYEHALGVHEDPMLEFYDGRYDFAPHGQFVSRCYLSRLLQEDRSNGLNLHSAVSDWSLDQQTYARFKGWAISAILERATVDRRPHSDTGLRHMVPSFYYGTVGARVEDKTLLQSLGVNVGDYDEARGRFYVEVPPSAVEKLKDFPADFSPELYFLDSALWIGDKTQEQYTIDELMAEQAYYEWWFNEPCRDTADPDKVSDMAVYSAQTDDEIGRRRRAERESTKPVPMIGRELATVLAALRYWQREGLMSSGVEHDIADDGGIWKPLGVEEIDDLCERLNAPESRNALEVNERLVDFIEDLAECFSQDGEFNSYTAPLSFSEIAGKAHEFRDALRGGTPSPQDGETLSP